MFEERRIKTGHALLALALVVVGVAIGWATDGGGGQGGPIVTRVPALAPRGPLTASRSATSARARAPSRRR